jgi:tRNA A37 threonylcarbamoyladenosine dehydratase
MDRSAQCLFSLSDSCEARFLDVMKIAVVGCGAVGSYYGAMLSRAGQDVHFLLRSD